MFTHKRADAWDALGTALLNADFTLETSWPVRTESEQSLHQARSNSAASTIFLVCRKRLSRRIANAAIRTIYLDEIEGDIRRSARESYSRSFGQGLEGCRFVVVHLWSGLVYLVTILARVLRRKPASLVPVT